MEKVIQQDLLGETRGRSVIYQILSRAFTRPGPDAHQLVAALNQVLETLGLQATAEIEGGIEALEIEYNRMFVGPGRLICPPYESVHRRDRNELDTGLVMGPSTIDVVRRYMDAGWEVDEKFKDLPDHIAVEIEFMHLLCEKQLESPDEQEKWRNKQREFIQSHLELWVSRFADCVEQRSSSSFYRSAALLLREMIEKETDSFDLPEPWSP